VARTVIRADLHKTKTVPVIPKTISEHAPTTAFTAGHSREQCWREMKTPRSFPDLVFMEHHPSSVRLGHGM
jgi:hypothetical protein